MLKNVSLSDQLLILLSNKYTYIGRGRVVFVAIAGCKSVELLSADHKDLDDYCL